MKLSLLASTLIIVAHTASVAAGEDLSGLAEKCKRGAPNTCRILELRKQLDASLFDDALGKYKWVLGPRAVAAIPARNATDRREKLKQAACTFYAEAWLSPAIAEYGRLTDTRLVDRAFYQICVEMGG